MVSPMSVTLESSYLSPRMGPVEAPPVKPAAPKINPTPGVTPLMTPPEPLWNVILLNDDLHTFEYVVEMLGAIFGHPPNRAHKMAQIVDETGRVIVATVHKELAELRQEQIETYGPDQRIPDCKESMRAEIEPAI